MPEKGRGLGWQALLEPGRGLKDERLAVGRQDLPPAGTNDRAEVTAVC
jgi:hypothetical protein